MVIGRLYALVIVVWFIGGDFHVFSGVDCLGFCGVDCASLAVVFIGL